MTRYDIMLKELREAFPSMSEEWADQIVMNMLTALAREGK